MSGQIVIKRVPDDLGNFTALTPAVHERVIEELAKGDWPSLAAFRAGVAPKSVQRWISKGLEEAAIEPYASFAADVVRQEAELAGRLCEVIMKDALGQLPPVERGERGPNVESAKWLLQVRFRFFWGSKDGQSVPSAIGVAEFVERTIATVDERRRDAAKRILAALPQEARANARKEGFVL